MKKILTTGLIAASALAVSACTITDITSSTSDTLDAVTPDVTLNRFVDVRIASIKQEAAVGQGENLQALAQLMGEPDSAAFSKMLQLNYDKLFNNLRQPSDLVGRIELLQKSRSI